MSDKVFMTKIVPGLSKITDYKLNGFNYLDWSRRIRVYLRSVEKDDHISQDPPTDETKKAWMRDDARLFLQIIDSIDNEVLGLVNHCEFVKELIDYLEYLYSGKGYVSRIYEVCKAFYRPEKESKTLTTYIMEFKKIYEELNMLLPFSTDIKVQQSQREQMAIMSFLAGLPSEFETAKSQILSDSEITSLKDVFSWVLHTESTPSNWQTNVLVANGEEKNDARRNYFLQAMSGCRFAGRETNVQTAANVPHTASTYSDNKNHVTGQGIVVPTCAPLANPQLEDRNMDRLCGSPTVISSTSRSFFNEENNVESRSAEESCKGADYGQAGLRTSIVDWKGADHGQAGLRTSIFDWKGADHGQAGFRTSIFDWKGADHGQAGFRTSIFDWKGADHGQAELRTSKGEWVEQYQLGVFITLTVLPSGKKELKRVRFRRNKFTEKEAKKWWEENQLSVYKKYDVERGGGK